MKDGLEAAQPSPLVMQQEMQHGHEDDYEPEPEHESGQEQEQDHEVVEEPFRVTEHSSSPAPAPALLLDHPRPLRMVQQGFWTAGVKEVPHFTCSPWDFYEPFLNFGTLMSLVACNGRSTVRAVKVFCAESWERSATCIPLLQIFHQNFAEVYEAYFFEGEVFVIAEYVGLSLEDLLQKRVCFSEPEIAYIISQTLDGIRFIWSRHMAHPHISIQNVRVSPNGEIKIDPTHFPRKDDLTSADMSSLRVLMLHLMREKDVDGVKRSRGNWSAGAIDFLESTSRTSPYQLSDHMFIADCSSSATTLGIVSYLASNDMWLHNDFHKRCSKTCLEVHI